ncbi:MAG: hypothetical protein SWZ49_25425 [Cyanobacteriota bacterium]|nr:hypothetical protein [Cyanobacteriota bacterium]
MIIVLFCILGIEIFSFLKDYKNIDLNKVESYLLNFASIEQVVSIELYHVNPQIKVICAKLMVNCSSKLRLDLLKKNIQSDLSHYFGLTECVITLKNSLGNTTGEQARITNEKMLNNFQALDFKHERYLSLKKQSIQDSN